MNVGQFIRKNIYHWIRSYLAIILVIAVILLSYSLLIVVQIKSDVDSNNSRFAEYYNTTLENSLQSLQDFIGTLLYSSTAEDIQSFSRDMIRSKDNLSNSYDLVYDIRDFAEANGFLDDIYIYYPAADHIIGQNGAFSSYNYFKTENVSMLQQQEEYELWMNTLFSKRKTGFYIDVEDDYTGTIYFYRELPFQEKETDRRVVVARISQDLLNNSFHKLMASANYHYAALVDEDGVVYGEAGDGALFKTEDGRFDFWNSSDEYVVYEALSDTWPLSFISVQDYGTAYQTVKNISWILGAGMAVALLVGLVVSFYYASKSRRAVAKIVDRFDGIPTDGGHSEFDFIGMEIDKLFQANRQAMDAAERQQKIISSFFLQELLQKENCTEKDVEIICSMYDVSMENPLFSLVVVWPKDNRKSCGMDRETFLQFATEVNDDDFVVYWTQINQIDIFLCNYEGKTKSPQGPVLDFAKKLRDKQTDAYQVQISPVMQSSAEISSVWQTIYGQIVPENRCRAVSVPHDEMTFLREFYNAIDNEDLTTAIRLVPDLNRKFLANRNASLTLCRKYALTAKLYESFPAEHMHRQIETLMQDIGNSAWDQELIALLQSLDQDINQHIDMRQVAEIARDMILQEYKNPQLSLHMIAERIGISQSYLSRLFKQKYGMSMIQYLNHIRIDQAKKLMLQGDDNLKVIALSVGFLSDVSLIRVFKKYENTTPGNFRNRIE